MQPTPARNGRRGGGVAIIALANASLRGRSQSHNTPISELAGRSTAGLSCKALEPIHNRMDGDLRMRVPNRVHISRPWRIHELTRDFRLEDVWELPGIGGPDAFPRLVQRIASADPSQSSSVAVRTLFAIRWKIGELLGTARTPASAPGCRRSATGCRQICAPFHPARTSMRSRSPRCTCSRTSGRRRSPTGPCKG
jgi:hypothetical protein